MGPLTRRYDIMGGNDENTHTTSNSIQNMIVGNRRINIGDVVWYMRVLVCGGRPAGLTCGCNRGGVTGHAV